MSYELLFILIIALFAMVVRLERQVSEIKRQLLQLKQQLTQHAAPTIAVSDAAAKPTILPTTVEPDLWRAAAVPPLPQRPPSRMQFKSTSGGLIHPLQQRLITFFTTGNVVVRVGMVVLFFGVAFLLKFATDHALLPLPLRLAGVSTAAVILIALGWRLRLKPLQRGYGLILQGGGIGLLYLTLYASAKLYGLLDLNTVFILMTLLVVFAAFMALRQNAPTLALFAATGGFAAPVLTSISEYSHILLFSYYALLNAGVFAIAWFRAWRSLNLIGFIFTFVVVALWGLYDYHDALRWSSESFLILFFLFYVAIAVLFSLRQPPQLRGLVDGTLIFGVPLAATGLQATLLHDVEYALAISSFAVSLLYALLALQLWRRYGEPLRLLAESFTALAIGFFTLALPLAFDDRLVTIAWGIEGAAMLWLGVRQQRLFARAAGLALQLMAIGLLLTLVQSRINDLPLLNALCIGGLLLAVAALFSSYQLEKMREKLTTLESALPLMTLFWGLLLWIYTGFNEADRWLTYAEALQAMVLYSGISMLLIVLLNRYFIWRGLQWAALGVLPLLLLLWLDLWQSGVLQLQGWGAIAWPIALIAAYRLLADMELRWQTQPPQWRGWPRWLKGWHVGLVLLITLLVSHDLAQHIDNLIS
ncbi:MAG: DUF2339 domain-containing protein, partial [Gammaproteobacteria bacterium]|nr:DUF2339 domain-containing protein [Gammaproteobacteria bacterium]